MNDISNTALVTLKCHIQDAKHSNPELNDSSSLKTYEYLKSNLDGTSKNIFENNIGTSLVKHTVLRAKKFDEYTIRFLQKYPEATVVNIGCGLDNRFERIDNGKCAFIDLDFPEIMDIKRKIFPPSGRYKQIAKSVFDFSWIKEVKSQPVILLAEGVFMYCKEEDVKALFDQITNQFSNSEIAFEVFSSKWLNGWKRKIIDFKLQKQLKFGKHAAFKFGIAESDELEGWSDNYKLISDWSYFDETNQNMINYFRKLQWTVYYKIN